MRKTSNLTPRQRMLGACALACVATLGLVACTGPSAAEVPGRTATSTPTPGGEVSTEQPTVQAAPELQPGASAGDNLPFFTDTVASVWNSEQSGNSSAYASALIGAGFDAEAVQRTSDTTAIGLVADTFSVSVRWHDGNCLIAQVGPSTGEPVFAVQKQLGDGTCLIGDVIAGQ